MRRPETRPSVPWRPLRGLFRAGEPSLVVVGAEEEGDALSGLRVLSVSSDSLFTVVFFREGTFSGQVHCNIHVRWGDTFGGWGERTSRCPCVQRVHVGLVSSHWQEMSERN